MSISSTNFPLFLRRPVFASKRIFSTTFSWYLRERKVVNVKTESRGKKWSVPFLGDSKRALLLLTRFVFVVVVLVTRRRIHFVLPSSSFLSFFFIERCARFFCVREGRNGDFRANTHIRQSSVVILSCRCSVRLLRFKLLSYFILKQRGEREEKSYYLLLLFIRSRCMYSCCNAFLAAQLGKLLKS